MSGRSALARAVHASGDAYRRAREALLAEAGWTEVLDRVLAAERYGWRVRLTAEALRLWREDAGLCRKIRLLMEADPAVLEPGDPLPGRWPAVHRGKAIAALGPAAVPRVLELLFKSQGFSDRLEQEALYAALILLRDRRAADPLAWVLRRRRLPEAGRRLAADALGRLGVAEAAPVLLERAVDRAEKAGIRRLAIHGLLRLRERAAAGPLLGVALDGAEPEPVRRIAVVTLAALEDRSAAPALTRRLPVEESPGVAGEIALALVVLGDGEALAAIEDLARRHPAAATRHTLETAARQLARRLG